jgi:predicted nucleotidyltransferase component of viral defense system
MNNIYKNILTDEMQKIYSLLGEFQDDFYLAGGTGLALLVGHRMSVDFDFFSDNPIKKTLLKKIEEIFSKFGIQVILNTKDELTIIIGSTKITFLYYPFRKVLPLETDGKIQILSIKEILASKAYSIGRRGIYKDYVDLYVGLNDNLITLLEILDIAKNKYGLAFNDRLFLEQLLYLDDIEEMEIIMINRPLPTKKELVDFFSNKISEIKI